MEESSSTTLISNFKICTLNIKQNKKSAGVSIWAEYYSRNMYMITIQKKNPTSKTEKLSSKKINIILRY